MHPYHQDLLVMRAVEDSDASPCRECALVAPQKIVMELLDRGLLEAADFHALGIDISSHV